MTFILLNSVSLRRKTVFSIEISLPVKTIERGRDVSGGTKTIAQYGFHIRICMAARLDSEDDSSDESAESDSNVINLYDSDVETLSEPLVESGPRPYQFEPRRIRRNDDEQELSPEQALEQDDSETDRLGNTDWYFICSMIYLHVSLIQQSKKHIAKRFFFSFSRRTFLGVNQ